MSKQYEFTYKIRHIDLQEVHILVEYMTTDPTLTSYILNVPASIRDENGVLIDIVEIIKKCAPHERWEAQEALVAQYNDILNKTELVPITNA